MRVLSVALAGLLSGLLGSACGGATPSPPPPAVPAAPAVPWQTAAVASPGKSSPTFAFVGATLMSAEQPEITDGVIVIGNGRILAMGPRDEVQLPSDATEISVAGKFITPGIIDAHSHMGVYPVPYVDAHADGNEATSPVTAQVRAADSFWPLDPALDRARAAGITTIQVLPGSANLVGGTGAVLKLTPARGVTDMQFPGAPATLKLACGENPKRVYGGRNSAPSTRMGSVAGYRQAFQRALEYRTRFSNWQRQNQKWLLEQQENEAKRKGGDEVNPAASLVPAPAPPDRDYSLDVLVGVLEGKVLPQIHCYRADEMLRMIEVLGEFGVQVRAFHHAVEAYKIRDVLSERRIAVATWADWWGFKIEAYDAVPENLAALTRSGVRGVLHSDSPILVQRLNQEAAKARAFGLRAGVEVSRLEALQWITLNPAWALGIDAEVGSLKAGKMADLVVWSGDPFSVYSRPEQVFIDGRSVYDQARGPAVSDFELGQSSALPAKPVAPASAPVQKDDK